MASGFLPTGNTKVQSTKTVGTHPSLQAGEHAHVSSTRQNIRKHCTFADQRKFIPCCPKPGEVKSALKVYPYLCEG